MKPSPSTLRSCFVLALAVLAGSAQAAVTLVPTNAVWLYLDTGVAPASSWTTPGYSAAGWKSGPAQLGYGDGDEATVVGYGADANNKFITTWFRHAFTVPNPSAYGGLKLQVLRDDGCVVYLNGQEVARYNLPTGSVTPTTVAPVAGEFAWDPIVSLSAALLLPGANVVAVEMHQSGGTSSDLSMAVSLQAELPVPLVTLAEPAQGSVQRSAQVNFAVDTSDPVGLASATLYLGQPLRSLTFSGPARTLDTYISGDVPAANYHTATSMTIDGAGPHGHALLRFLNLSGTGPDQVPPGTLIKTARLRVYCSNASVNPLNAYRLLEEWTPSQATWSQRQTGVAWGNAGADGSISRGTTMAAGDCTATGWRTFDVTALVQEWCNGQPNLGFVLLETGTDGTILATSESTTPPELIVEYGGGADTPVATQELSGVAGRVTFTLALSGAQEYVWNCVVTNTAGISAGAAADGRFTVDTHYPAEPVVVAPAQGATPAPPDVALNVQVEDPDADPALTVTFHGRGLQQDGEPFTVAILPDTQKYVLSSTLAPIFTKQTQWIADHAGDSNIVFMTHMGDVADLYNSTEQYVNANASLSVLDQAGVPYGLLPGNHDQPTTLFNQYFPVSRYSPNPWYGGNYPAGLNDNSYQLFTAGGMDFIVVHLGAGPPASVISWANTVLATYANRLAIVSTHGFLGLDASRYVSVMGDTEYIWRDLIAPNPNVHFVLCGHMHGEARRSDAVNGRVVHQLLADYQAYPEGGEGWMRLLCFAPGEDRVHVKTWSPHKNSFQTDADSEFSLDFPMSGFRVLGQVTVASGQTASLNWNGLVEDETYEWYVTVTDSTGRSTRGPVSYFTPDVLRDTTPPVISGLAITGLTENAAQLSWTTDEAATSEVTLLDPQNQGTLFTDLNLVTLHDLQLSGLQPATTYTCNIVSRDGNGNASLVHSLEFTTQAANLPPSAEPLLVTAQEDIAANISLAGSDPENGTLTFTVTQNPAHGTLAITESGLVYTPSLNYHGADAFTYTASDGILTSVPAIVSITVESVNDAPIALPANVSVIEDGEVPTLLSGTDVDGDPLSYEVVQGPAHGALPDTAPNLTYTPAADFNGTDAFTFTVSDGTATATATVSITVTAMNDAPLAAAASTITAEDTALGVTLAGSDADGDPLTYSVTTDPVHGTLSGNAPDLTYTPATDFIGTDSFTFTVDDGTGPSEPATVSVTVTRVNHAPIAQSAVITTAEDTALPVTLAGTDTDSDPLTYSVTAPPAHGTLSGTAPDLTYTPAPDFNGADSFTFTVNDGAETATATVSITVTAVNDAPVPTTASVATAEDTTLAVTLAGTDADSDPLTYSVTAPPAHGTLSGTAPNVTYTPTSDFNGTDSFTFTVNDGTDTATATVSITVTPVNDAPLATANSVITAEDTTLAVTLAGTDTDSDPLTYSVTAPPAHGTLSGTAQNLTYTPAPDFNGADSFTFTVNDGTDTSTATVSITVTPVNDTPLATAASATTAEDNAQAVTLSGTDVDGDPLTYSIAQAPANGTLSGTAPNLTYTPAPDFNGADTFTFTVSDGTLDSEPALVTITVAAANDAPLAKAGADQTVAQLAEVTLDASGSSDVDGDTLTYVWMQVSGPEVVLDNTASATPRFTTLAGELDDNLIFEVTVSDGSIEARDTVTVTAENRTYDAVARTEPQITLGTPSAGAYTATHAADGMTQSFVEAEVQGDRALEVIYTLECLATPGQVVGLTLRLQHTYVDAEDTLRIGLWNGTVFVDITGQFSGEGTCTPANPEAYVLEGKIKVLLVDAGAANDTAAGELSVDYLQAHVQAYAPVDTQAPAVPAGLGASVLGSRVDLTWSPNAESDLAGYRVYRAAAGTGNYTELSGLITAMAFSDTPSTYGSYDYAVLAEDLHANRSILCLPVNVRVLQPATHVSAITLTVKKVSKKYQSTATVTILDRLNVAVPGAIVTGSWYFKGSLVRSGATATTDASGRAQLLSPLVTGVSGNLFRFVVTRVTKTGYLYNSTANTLSESTIPIP